MGILDKRSTIEAAERLIILMVILCSVFSIAVAALIINHAGNDPLSWAMWVVVVVVWSVMMLAALEVTP